MYRQVTALNGSYDQLYKALGSPGEENFGTQLFLGFCLYEGQFADKQPHGRGAFLTQDILMEGVWCRGSLAEGVVWWRTGARYTGTMCPKTWYHFKEGTLQLECGLALSGVWEDGELVEGTLLSKNTATEIVFEDHKTAEKYSSSSQFSYKTDKVHVQVQRRGCEVAEFWTASNGVSMSALYRGTQLFCHDGEGGIGCRLKFDLTQGSRMLEGESPAQRTLWFPRGVKVEVRLPEEKAQVSFPVLGDLFEHNTKQRFNSLQQPELSGFYIYKVNGIDYVIRTNSLDELFRHSVVLERIRFETVYKGLGTNIDNFEQIMMRVKKGGEGSKPAASSQTPHSPEIGKLSTPPPKSEPAVSSVKLRVRDVSSFRIFERKSLVEVDPVSLFFGTRIKGKNEGFCEVYYENGSKFRGFFRNGLRNGSGVSIGPSGETLIGVYESDQPVGAFKRVLPTGEVETGYISGETFVRVNRVKAGGVTIEGIISGDGFINGLANVFFEDGSRLRCRVTNERVYTQKNVLYYTADSSAFEGELKVKEKMGFFSNEDVLVSINLTQGRTEFLS